MGARWWTDRSSNALTCGLYGIAARNTEHRADVAYDPATDTWSQIASMTDAREHHTSTLLPNGKVLVAGGGAGVPQYLASAEL